MAELSKEKGWQTGKSLMECHRYMLDSQVSCDIKFQFYEGDTVHTIGAHRYMLICRSPVFEHMLTVDCVGSYDPVLTLRLSNVEPDVFKEVLRYIYYDGADVAGQNVISIFYLAKKYELEGLVEQCMEYLRSNMSVANICTLLNSCPFDEVTRLCLACASCHPAAVLGSSHFLDLTQDALYALLSGHLLYDHQRVFRACARWAKRRLDEGSTATTPPGTTSLRDVLGRCVHRLGFTSMTSSQLAAAVKDAPMLSEVEQLALFRYSALPEEEAATAVKALGFDEVSLVLTTPCFHRSIVAAAIPLQDDRPGAVVSSLLFTPDRDVAMRGFSVFGTTKSSLFSLSAELREERTGGDSPTAGGLCTLEAGVWSRGNADPIRVALPATADLASSTAYRLRVVMSGFRASASHVYKGVDEPENVESQRCNFLLANDPSDSAGYIAQIIYSPK